MEYINRLLRKGGSKKSDPVGHQLPGDKREFAEENDFSQCQQSTPVRHLECDTESDTTAEYESAGEVSPWEKPSNVSALADYLAGVHLSTPNKIHNELNYFPFSPISAEDECDDEVTAIISNGSQSSSHTLSFHEREEISLSREEKIVSHEANTSFSDVDPEEFKISAPCKRHSETNVSSFFHSETLKFGEVSLGEGGVNFKSEMSCSVEENKLKTPSPSLNESEEITSSVIATVEKLCESVNNEVTSSGAISPKKYDPLNLSNSNINESKLTDITISAEEERKSFEQSSPATRSNIYFASSNKSPVPVILEKDFTSLDSLEENNATVISEMESSSNVLQTSHINDYVSSTKHKIDTIFNSKKEIVSNVICETKQQIDNLFKRKSPIKDLSSNTVVSHVIDSIKNMSATESDLSPQKNVIIEKISSPISSAKQKIDSLFSPKKAGLDKEIFEKTPVEGVSVVKELCGNESLNEESEKNQDNSSFNTVTVEDLHLVASTSGLTVIPLTSQSESHEVIETTKQQIDKIFKSVSPQKVNTSSEVLELSNSTMSTDLEQEYEICVTSSPTSESGHEHLNSKQMEKSVKELSEDESLSSSREVIVSDQQEIVIDEVTVSSSTGEPESSVVLHENDKSNVLEDIDETSSISEVNIPMDLKLEFKDHIGSESETANTNAHLNDSISDVTLNKTTHEVCETTQQENIAIVQGGDNEKTEYHVNNDEQIIEDSILQKSIKVDEQQLSDYQPVFEVFKKNNSETSRTFHVISPKKENLNISLSLILDQKEVIVSENITETITKISSDDLISTNKTEHHCENTSDLTDTINSNPEISSIAPDLDQSVVHMEHGESIVSNLPNITPLETSQVVDDKVIGTYGELPMLPPKSPSMLHSEVPPESAKSSDADVAGLKEVNITELPTSFIEEVIKNTIVYEDHNNSYEGDSQFKPQEEALDITAIADDMTLRREEVEGFVVVDVAELDKHVSVSDSPQQSLSVPLGTEKKEDEAQENTLHIASTSEVSPIEVVENKVQSEPASCLKELMKGNYEITDVKNQINVECIKKEVEPDIKISESRLVTDIINNEENVNSSSLVVSSVEVNDRVSNTTSEENQLNFPSKEVMSPNVELVSEVEMETSIAENNLKTDLVAGSEITVVSIPTEGECTEVDKNLSALNGNNDFNKKTDDSAFIKNDIAQGQPNSVNSHSSGVIHSNISSEKQTVDSSINNLQNDEQINMNQNITTKSLITKESVEKTHDFESRQIQSESKTEQLLAEESICHLSTKFEKEFNLGNCVTSEIISEKQVERFSMIPDEFKQDVSLARSNGNATAVKNITKDNAVVNESIVNFNNQGDKMSLNDRRRSPPGPEFTSDLFSEIFQHGKDQMGGVSTKSEVSVIQEGAHEINQQNSSSATSVSKSASITSYDDSEFFKNVKVKSPPFACPVSSDSIAFGSPSELSLSPLDSFPPGSKCESPKSSPSDTSTGYNTSTVTCIKTNSSSAEIRMGSKSSSESLEIVKSDVSKQNNELSPSLQATLQIQGEMSTRNEKYSYNINKSSKDFRSSPVHKNCEEVNKYSSHSDNFKTFKLDDLSKSTIERKSYEDLLDRCLEQERLLGFDETIKEEADKLIQEIANASSDDICVQSDDFPPANANNSEAGPVTADEDLNKADLFQDASLFDFDYLSKIGKGKPSRRLARESLFLKFDPLAAAAAAVATPEPAQEMAQADSSDVIDTPPRAPLHNGEDKLVCITPSNEAVVCSPASSTVATPPRSKARPSSCSATPTLRHEILSKEISKLQDLMMRQESSYQEQIAACTEEVEQLREQLAALEARDNQVDLQGKLAATEAEAGKLRKELAEATESKKQLMMIMEEYEKTISQVVTMREDDKKKFEIEKEQLSMEREGALQHLRNMEIAFNDVHQKYEKCKEVIEAFKHNEEQYKISLNENRRTIIQQEENYEKLKEHAAQKLEQANIEISEMKKAHQAEIAKMVAVQRKMEIRMKSLEESLEQKKREAAELTKICDDLITKVEQ